MTDWLHAALGPSFSVSADSRPIPMGNEEGKSSLAPAQVARGIY